MKESHPSLTIVAPNGLKSTIKYYNGAYSLKL